MPGDAAGAEVTGGDNGKKKLTKEELMEQLDEVLPKAGLVYVKLQVVGAAVDEWVTTHHCPKYCMCLFAPTSVSCRRWLVLVELSMHQSRAAHTLAMPLNGCGPSSGRPRRVGVGAAANLPSGRVRFGCRYSEKGTIGEVLCKPKIIPIKSVSLEALEAMLKAAASADDGRGQ